MVNALCKELQLRKDYLDDKTLQSIYFGGGTPSVLAKEEIVQILDAIRKLYIIKEDAEITLEANPDDLTREKLIELKEAGINRLSIGVQSFIEEELKWMNRSHTAAQSTDSVRMAQEAGFENITIDLIYGSKFQNHETWQRNLDMAFSLDVPHISAYNLTIEERTVLGNHYSKGKEPAINDQFSMECFEILIAQSKANGFLHYEISNFAKPGFIAVHNSNYWKGIHYLGLGPSAHSFNGIARQWNVSGNPVYMKTIEEGKVPCEVEVLTTANRYNEYILTSLRTMWGIDLKYIETNFPFYTGSFKRYAEQYIASGKMIADLNTYKLSEAGKKLADKISADFFEE